MEITVSDRNYARLVELRAATEADSVDEVIDWLLDFWFSWFEKGEKDSALQV